MDVLLPRYQQVKKYILSRIDSGELRAGVKIESENKLAELLNFSRMTVNRALRELTAEGWLKRIKGAGTFVVGQKSRPTLLEIQSIAEEIRDSGGMYSCDIPLLQEEKAKPLLALSMGLQPYASVYHLVIVHMDNGLALQLEDQYVNSSIVPDYLVQNFFESSSDEYLSGLFPALEVENVVEAVIADVWIQDLLHINTIQPCLALRRILRDKGEIMAKSSFFYPGCRYAIGSRSV